MKRNLWLCIALGCCWLTASARAAAEASAEPPAAATDPAVALFDRANQHARSRDFDLALAEYSEALRLNSNLAAAWNNRANLYACQHDYTQAVADYEQALRLQPLAVVVFCNRGLAHAARHAPDRALADYDEALRLCPDCANILNHQRLTYFASTTNFDQTFELGSLGIGGGYALAYYQRGNARLQREEFDLAIADYTAAIQLGFQEPNALINRGVAHVGLRYYDRAREDFTAASALDANRAAAYFGRAVVALYQRDFEQALMDFNEAIALEPSHAAAYHGRGFAWNGLGNPDKAKADAAKALRLDLDTDAAVHACTHGLLRPACQTLTLKCRTRAPRGAEPRHFEAALPWRQLAVDLCCPAEPERPRPTPSAAPTDEEPTPEQVAAVAWTPATPEAAPPPRDLPAMESQLMPAPAAPAPAVTLPQTTESPPVALPAPVAPVAATPTPTPAPANAPGEAVDHSLAFWYSPAPIFFTVVLAALILGASMVCIPLLLLLPQFNRSRADAIDVQQLLGVLLRERGTNWAKPAMAAATPPPGPAPARKTANGEDELAQCILDDNLDLRDDAAAEAVAR